MGNICLKIKSSTTKTSKLIGIEGNLEINVELPVKAAEIMLENPGFVISSIEKIRSNGRLHPLCADDDLMAGKAYVLIPMCRVNGKVTEVEMAMVKAACVQKRRRRSTKKKLIGVGSVLPIAAPVKSSPRNEGDEAKSLITNCVGSDGSQSAKFRPSWIPGLDPIIE